MKEIHLSLSLSEMNQVLHALGRLPHSEVGPVINKILDQAKEQFPAEEPQEKKTLKDN